MLSEAYRPTPLDLGSREEVDLFGEEKINAELINQLAAEFNTVINELAEKRLSPSETGQEVIHELAKLRFKIAADLPLRDEELTPETKDILAHLYRFEQLTRAILEQNYHLLFRSPDQESTVDNLIDGATAEECAIRMIGLARPDNAIYFPSTEDEHNGVDFFTEFPSGRQLAIQVKIVRYPEDEEWRHDIIHLVNSEQQIPKVVGEVMDGAIPTQGKMGKIYSSLEKNINYTHRLDPTGSLSTGLMALSTSHLNPRLSPDDVTSIEEALSSF